MATPKFWDEKGFLNSDPGDSWSRDIVKTTDGFSDKNYLWKVSIPYTWKLENEELQEKVSDTMVKNNYKSLPSLVMTASAIDKLQLNSDDVVVKSDLTNYLKTSEVVATLENNANFVKFVADQAETKTNSIIGINENNPNINAVIDARLSGKEFITSSDLKGKDYITAAYLTDNNYQTDTGVKNIIGIDESKTDKSSVDALINTSLRNFYTSTDFTDLVRINAWIPTEQVDGDALKKALVKGDDVLREKTFLPKIETINGITYLTPRAMIDSLLVKSKIGIKIKDDLTQDDLSDYVGQQAEKKIDNLGLPTSSDAFNKKVKDNVNRDHICERLGIEAKYISEFIQDNRGTLIDKNFVREQADMLLTTEELKQMGLNEQPRIGTLVSSWVKTNQTDILDDDTIRMKVGCQSDEENPGHYKSVIRQAQTAIDSFSTNDLPTLIDNRMPTIGNINYLIANCIMEPSKKINAIEGSYNCDDRNKTLS